MSSTSMVSTGRLISPLPDRSNMPPLMNPGSAGNPSSVTGPVDTVVYFNSGISCSCHPNASA
jgi:hypothetical protein